MERDESGTVSVAAILRTEELASEFFHETEYRLHPDKVDDMIEFPGRPATTPELIAASLGQQALKGKDDIDAHRWLEGATTALSMIVRLREG